MSQRNFGWQVTVIIDNINEKYGTNFTEMDTIRLHHMIMWHLERP